MMLNTKGAALHLGISTTWVHKLTESGRLQAYFYNEDGELTRHIPGQKRQGQGLYFREEDVMQYTKSALGRPKKEEKQPVK